MKLDGEYEFDAPRDVVWDALFDPEILASVMPGCKKLEKVGEQEYEGVLNIKIGPVQGHFDGKIQLSDIEKPDSYHMDIDGRGAPGFVKAEAEVKLTGEGDTTTLHYESDANVGGRIATVGQRLLDSSAKSITRQSLEGLSKVIESRTATPEGEEPTPVEAPSQSEFARNVAKDVAKDMASDMASNMAANMAPRAVLVGVLIALAILLIVVFVL